VVPARAWAGSAAAACRAELLRAARLAGRVRDPLRDASVVLGRYRSALLQAREGIDRVRSDYDEELTRHRNEMARMAEASVVPPQLRRLMTEDLRHAQQADLAVHHRRYQRILDDLHADSVAVGRRLSALARSVVPGGTWARGSPADAEVLLVAALPLLQAQRRLVTEGRLAPPQGTPAGVVRQWWSLLTADEQQRLIVVSPASVGNLDGLPARVRSEANESVLDRLIAQLGSDASLDDAGRLTLANCLAVRHQIDVVRRAKDPHSRVGSVVQLLVFDPRAFAGDGRAAIAVGDVDSADHVAFLVPGYGSTVRASLPGLVGNAALLVREAERASAETATATVAWIGYDAPSLLNVARDDAAEAGADLLAADVMAVQASRDVAPHLTVIGHSYGSTTTGTALRDHVTGVDDAVLVGSPGPNVEHVSALHMPSGHVFVGANSRDPVSYVDRFGMDPTHEAFGAVRFQAEDMTRNSWRMDIDDHSKYFEPKTESLSNMVRIVVGSYGQVQVAAYREEWPLLPDGINTDPEADREPTVPAG
jgi:hypothetical protein